MSATEQQGLVIPRGRTLAHAVMAGLLWGLAVHALLLLAGWFSVRGHGRWATAPRAVRAARAVTWGVFLMLSVGAVAVLTLWDDSCFRSCQPFPR